MFDSLDMPINITIIASLEIAYLTTPSSFHDMLSPKLNRIDSFP